MDDKELKNDLVNIVGFELLDEEVKNKITLAPDVKEDVEKWLSKYVNNQNLFGIKTCCIEYIEENKTLQDFRDELGEDGEEPISEAMELYKDYIRKVKRNESQCPTYKTCPFYQHKMIQEGMKCPMEIAESAKLMQGYFREMDIGEDNFTDMVVANHLVAANLITDRTLKSLAVEPLVKQVKIIGKDGGVRYDTKINDNFLIYEKTMALSEKLRKNLMLNREDRLKTKKLDEQLDQRSIKNKLKEQVRNLSRGFDINDIVEAETMENEEEYNIENIGG